MSFRIEASGESSFGVSGWNAGEGDLENARDGVASASYRLSEACGDVCGEAWRPISTDAIEASVGSRSRSGESESGNSRCSSAVCW